MLLSYLRDCSLLWAVVTKPNIKQIDIAFKMAFVRFTCWISYDQRATRTHHLDHKNMESSLFNEAMACDKPNQQPCL